MAIYEDIARDLLAGIEAGRYPVGQLVPTEMELATRYGVSRQTIRAAMRRLTDLGAVSRRKGSGTRVAARDPIRDGFQQTLGSLSDLVALAAATRRDIQGIETVVMDRQAARTFGCPPGSRWVRLAYVRAAVDGREPPLAWVNCFVDEGYREALRGVESDPRLVSDMIADRYGVAPAEVRQTVAAVGLPHAYGVALGAEPGSPALAVVRRYFDSRGRLYEVSESFHPAGRFVVTSVLKRLGPASGEARP